MCDSYLNFVCQKRLGGFPPGLLKQTAAFVSKRVFAIHLSHSKNYVMPL